MTSRTAAAGAWSRTILDPAAVGHARLRIDRAISSSARGLARRGVGVAAERDVPMIAVDPALDVVASLVTWHSSAFPAANAGAMLPALR